LAEEINDENFLMVPYNLIQLTGEINREITIKMTELLLEYDYRNQLIDVLQPIHILINSPGGEVSSAWQIIDIMDAIKSPVYTIGTGLICSSAVSVFISGEPGHRILSSHSSIMCHQYSWGVEGRYQDLKAIKPEIDNIQKRLEDHYCDRTGIDRNILKNELFGNADKWLTPQQAKKIGLADSVMNFSKRNPFTIKKELQPKNQRKIIKSLQKQQENLNKLIEMGSEENEVQ
jgi:ATP-dependent Clp protease protease subunit